MNNHVHISMEPNGARNVFQLDPVQGRQLGVPCWRVLIFDADVSYAWRVARQLRALGHHVLTARTTAELDDLLASYPVDVLVAAAVVDAKSCGWLIAEARASAAASMTVVRTSVYGEDMIRLWLGALAEGRAFVQKDPTCSHVVAAVQSALDPHDYN